MKKIIFNSLGISLTMLAVSLASYGQATTTSLRFANYISSAENSASNARSILNRSDVNSKAARNFVKAYKDVSEEKWYKLPDALIAMFTRKDIDYRIDYDRKGNWLSTIRTYNENELPGDVRHIVKSAYYDYDIIVVQEIEKANNPFTYIVHLEGKTKLINLRISDGEMEEWQKFDKARN